MMISRRRFFDSVRGPLFDGRLTPAQVDGVSAILDAWDEQHRAGDQRWLAYMLATAHHETGRRMQPVRESFADSDAQAILRLDAAYAKGVLTWVRTPYWRKDADGKSWLGRGLVQITHKANYRKLGRAIGIDLVAEPDRALDPATAVAILFTGMTRGLFTNRKLADFFAGDRAEWVAARKIINGLERADLVARHALAYHAALNAAAQRT